MTDRKHNCCYLVLTLAAFFGIGATHSVQAHPVSVTQTRVYVAREQVTTEMQIFLEDLFLFHNLKPNNEDFLSRDVILKGIELHKKFILERFVIRDVAGEALKGRVVGVVGVDKLPDEGVSIAALMAHSLKFELEHELSAPPEFLTFSQNFTDKAGILPSEMKLTVKQENAKEAHTLDLRPGDVQTVRLDWKIPPLSPEASKEEREKWAKAQKEATLGITSYSSVYSFLYIEDHEVRHEILIPVLTLEQSVLIARDEDNFLDLAEQDEARVQIEAFFKTGNPIEIDGTRAEPVVSRCDFYGLDFKDFARQAPRKKVSLSSARVGIILTYPTKTPPKTVKLTWNRFNNYVWAVNLVVFADDKTTKETLSRIGEKNVFTWKNSGKPAPPPPQPVKVELPVQRTIAIPIVSVCFVPLILIVLVWKIIQGKIRSGLLWAGGFLLAALVALPFLHHDFPNPWDKKPELSDEQAGKIFAQLHKTTYRAFDYRKESDIYDALALSLDSDLLTDVYLDIRRSLEMAEQGGARSRVGEVKILSGTKKPLPNNDGPGFEYQCRWNVSGTVEHWGHIHERTNQYLAQFTVQPIDDHWKITKVELLDEQRVQFETRLRGR